MLSSEEEPAGALSSSAVAWRTSTPSRRLARPGGNNLVTQVQAACDRNGIGGVQSDVHIRPNRLAVLNHIDIGHTVLKKHSVTGHQHRSRNLVRSGG